MVFIKNNLFWIVLGLVVVALSVGYLMVARGMDERIVSLERESQRAIGTLDKWEARAEIPNPEMVRSAAEERTRWERHYGELLMLFAARSGMFDRAFDEFRLPFHRDQRRVWEVEYERRMSHLAAHLAQMLPTPDRPVLQFRVMRDTYETDQERIRAAQMLQREYWLLKYAVEAMIDVARPEPDRAPLILELSRMQLVATSVGLVSHDWVQTIGLDLAFTVQSYRDLNRLIEKVHNSPKFLQVTNYEIERINGGSDIEEEAPQYRVVMGCDIIEFLPAIYTVSFPTNLFETRAMISDWLENQIRDLRTATQFSVEHHRPLRQRILSNLKWEMEAALSSRLQDIDGSLEGDGEEAGGDAETAEEWTGEHDRAREEFREEVRQVLQESARFDLTRDYLVPLVDGKAYLIQNGDGEFPLIVARWEDRWYLGHSERPEDVTADIDRLDAEEVDDTLTLYLDRVVPVEGRVRQMRALLPEPVGDWQTYYLARHRARPVSMSDVAFKFGYALLRARDGLQTERFQEATGTVIITEEDALVDRDITIRVPISRRMDTGDLVITVRLRR